MDSELGMDSELEMDSECWLLPNEGLALKKAIAPPKVLFVQ